MHIQTNGHNRNADGRNGDLGNAVLDFRFLAVDPDSRRCRRRKLERLQTRWRRESIPSNTAVRLPLHVIDDIRRRVEAREIRRRQVDRKCSIGFGHGSQVFQWCRAPRFGSHPAEHLSRPPLGIIEADILPTRRFAGGGPPGTVGNQGEFVAVGLPNFHRQRETLPLCRSVDILSGVHLNPTGNYIFTLAKMTRHVKRIGVRPFGPWPDFFFDLDPVDEQPVAGISRNDNTGLAGNIIQLKRLAHISRRGIRASDP